MLKLCMQMGKCQYLKSDRNWGSSITRAPAAGAPGSTRNWTRSSAAKGGGHIAPPSSGDGYTYTQTYAQSSPLLRWSASRGGHCVRLTGLCVGTDDMRCEAPKTGRNPNSFNPGPLHLPVRGPVDPLLVTRYVTSMQPGGIKAR
jgi:hypothetical protein